MSEARYVPDMLVVGPDGLPVVRQGFTEIGGLRFYGDRVVVGPHGQPVLDPGRVEIVESRAGNRWR